MSLFDFMKECVICGERKAETEFYAKQRKCKPCYCERVRSNRKERVDYYRAYDRNRGSRITSERTRQRRLGNVNKYRAQTAVGNAIRDGRLAKAPCVVCGATEHVHGHHDNYARPLDVTWLCAAHHRERHKSLGWG